MILKKKKQWTTAMDRKSKTLPSKKSKKRAVDLKPAIFSDPTSLNSAECESHSRPVTLSNPTAPDRPSSPAPPVEADHHDTAHSGLDRDDEEDDIIRGIQVNPETLDVPVAAAATSDLL